MKKMALKSSLVIFPYHLPLINIIYIYISVIPISINNASRSKMHNFNIYVSFLLFCDSFLFIPSHL